jgi:hypothetical protein
MLSEIAVSTFMVASITGAGLILAIYTLFTPMSHRIFEERVERLDVWIKKFEDLRTKLTADSTDKQLNQLKLYKKRINETKGIPWYFGAGVILSFMALMASALFSGLWLSNTAVRTDNNEAAMVGFLLTGFVIFTFVSLFIVTEVYETMKKDFDEIKQKRKDALEKVVG